MTEGTNVATMLIGLITRIRPAQHSGPEHLVNDDRVKTFIELTRQVLEEDRIRQSEFGRSGRLLSDYVDPNRERERELLRRKS